MHFSFLGYHSHRTVMSDTKNIRHSDTKGKVKKIETFSYQETEMVSIFIIYDIMKGLTLLQNF